MILVSVMLAVFLGWPLVFGGRDSGGMESVRTSAKVVAAAPQTQLLQTAAQTVKAAASTPEAESCYKRYQREVKLCSGNGGAACRLKSADNWDLCEATGFWPN